LLQKTEINYRRAQTEETRDTPEPRLYVCLFNTSRMHYPLTVLLDKVTITKQHK